MEFNYLTTNISLALGLLTIKGLQM